MKQLFPTDRHSTYCQIWQDLKRLLSIPPTSPGPKQTNSRSISPSQQRLLSFPISPHRESLKHSQTLQGCRAPGGACSDHLEPPRTPKAGGWLCATSPVCLPQPPQWHPGIALCKLHFPKAVLCEYTTYDNTQITGENQLRVIWS